MVDQIHLCIRQELDKQIDVAVRAHITSCGRSENRQFPDVVPTAEFRQRGLIDPRIAELERAAHVILFIMHNLWAERALKPVLTLGEGGEDG